MSILRFRLLLSECGRRRTANRRVLQRILIISRITVILNMADKGFKVCAYNRTTSKVDDFLANEAKGE